MKKSAGVLISGSVLVIANLAIIIFSTGDFISKLASYVFPIISSLVSVAGLASAFRNEKSGLLKTCKMLLFSGMALYFIAESLYVILGTVYRMNMNEAFPTIADFFWVAGYLPLFAGLSVMIFYLKERYNPGMSGGLPVIFLIGLIPFLAGFVYMFLMPVIEDNKTTALAKFVCLFYPTGDIFLIVSAFLILYLTKISSDSSPLIPWRYMAAGFICITLADIIYSYLTWKGTYGFSEYIDVAWNAGYFLIGAGGFTLQESMVPAD